MTTNPATHETTTVEFEGVKVEVPTLINLPFQTYKLYREWISAMFELQKTRNAADAAAIESILTDLISSLLENVEAYAEQAGKFSMRQHTEFITKWVGIESSGKSPEQLQEALDALGKA